MSANPSAVSSTLLRRLSTRNSRLKLGSKARGLFYELWSNSATFFDSSFAHISTPHEGRWLYGGCVADCYRARRSRQRGPRAACNCTNLERPKNGRDQGRLWLSGKELLRLRRLVSENLRPTSPRRCCVQPGRVSKPLVRLELGNLPATVCQCCRCLGSWCLNKTCLYVPEPKNKRRRVVKTPDAARAR